MVFEERFSWLSVLATVLWLVAAIGGLTLIQPLLVVFFAVGQLLGSGDPTSVTEDKYRIISARYFGVFAYGAVWLAGVIFLNSWFLKARNAAQLLLRFGIVISGEALVWGLGVLVQELVMS